MYESFYNLKAKPFALSPDPNFFFGSKEHNRVLAYLRYGINQGEGFIVVTGDVGTGKTMLVGTLLAEISDNSDIIAAQLVTTQLDPDDLLRMVAAAFRLPHENLPKATLLSNLESFLKQRAREGKRVLLVVDEAQNLQPHSLEELRMLSNFQVGNRSLLQSFLLGQAEFRDTMRSENLEQFRQRIIASYHLGPMGPDETRGYIEHRLKVVAWRDDPTFSREAYELIYDLTDGVPRRINTLCDRILLFAFLEESHDITVETVENVRSELQEESPYSQPAQTAAAVTNEVTADVAVASQVETKISTSAKTKKRKKSSGSAASRIDDLESRLERIESIVSNARAFIKSIIS